MPASPMQWPADHVERWPVAELIPYTRNANIHSDAQIAQIAASMREFGWTMPVLADEAGTIIAGHCRVLAAQRLGWTEAPVIVARGWSNAQKRAYTIADNRLARSSAWNTDMLAIELDELRGANFDLELLGFDAQELTDLLSSAGDGTSGSTDDADAIPEVEEIAVSVPGDVWLLGKHRVMCGDSTNAAHVASLVQGEKANLLHADPPYGLGFDDEGVINDDLEDSELVEFQMRWWATFRPHLQPNASVYIWGVEEPLWMFWFRLKQTETLTFKNEIVWDKKNAPMMKADNMTRYVPATERCLFFSLGRFVFMVNQTKDDYWEGWEPLRSWLCAERDRVGWSATDIRRICDNHMYGHWFGRSQWSFISRENYLKLASAAAGKAFARPYDDLLAEYRTLAAIYTGDIREPRVAEFRAARPYFDNAHSVMRDVWEFPRVTGEERHGHPTPKPVEMMERVMLSSSRDGELVIEPFLGTGSTMIAAQRAGRRCFGMELDPRWVDVCIRRWQAFTGAKAINQRTGQPFDSTSEGAAR